MEALWITADQACREYDLKKDNFEILCITEGVRQRHVPEFQAGSFGGLKTTRAYAIFYLREDIERALGDRVAARLVNDGG